MMTHKELNQRITEATNLPTFAPGIENEGDLVDLSPSHAMILLLDDDDEKTIRAEIEQRIKEGRLDTLPDGESNLAGAFIAEMIRDLEEYRAMYKELPLAD